MGGVSEKEKKRGVRGGVRREGALKKVSDSPQHPDQTPTGPEKVWRFHSSDPRPPANFPNSQKRLQNAQESQEVNFPSPFF